MTARTARLGVATALTLATATLTACGSTGPDAPAKTPAAPTPQEQLLLSVPDEEAGAYRFAIKGNEQPVSGVLDAPKKTFQIKLSQAESDPDFVLTVNTLVVDDQSWWRFSISPSDLPGLPKMPKKWVELDPSKIKNPDETQLAYGDETDPGHAALLIENATGVERTAPGKYAGTTDLTRAAEAEIVDKATLDKLGEKAGKVPFTAVVDGKGRLTAMTVKIPAAAGTKARTYSVVYSGFDGTPTPQAPAAGDQIPAPAFVYDMLNG